MRACGSNFTYSLVQARSSRFGSNKNPFLEIVIAGSNNDANAFSWSKSGAPGSTAVSTPLGVSLKTLTDSSGVRSTLVEL